MGGGECSRRHRALSRQPRHGTFRPENSRRKEERELVYQALMQEGPVDLRAAFHQHAGDLLGAERGKNREKIRTSVLGLGLNLADAHPTRLQIAAPALI